jgi:DNA-binding transcriptional LysR family regulator
VDLKTVSSAAKKLHLTQTAVTQRIKALEAELNLSLFLRSKNGMKLTAEGEILFRSCIEAKSIEGRLLAGLKKAGEDEEVDLCIVGPASVIGGRVIKQSIGGTKPILSQFFKYDFLVFLSYSAVT